LEVYKTYQESDIVVARAGANTVSEIMTVKRPAILIPLPISFMDEQTKNAEIAKAWGVAKIIRQDALTPEILFKNIEDSINNFSGIVKGIRLKESPDRGASKKILVILKKYVK